MSLCSQDILFQKGQNHNSYMTFKGKSVKFLFNLIIDGTNKMVKLAQRAFEKLGIYRQYQDKISGLDMKLVDVQQGHELESLGFI